ncbi:MAG: TIGR00730 family Rossman fold protein [Deltaproteobacteria bacterium]|nr:TIGR00730 family Rossman fold protein [Deltaproteobacteria bacterium]
MKRICVFCGANTGNRPEYREAAANLGRTLAQKGLGLVYGGGNVGLMGVLAEAALAAGGEVVGVIPTSLVEKELAHNGLSDMVITASMHERKQEMFDRSDGVIALPGGFGTLDEFFEVITWCQLGFHQKPCGLLNVLDFFQPLMVHLAHAVAEGFITEVNAGLIQVHHHPEELLRRFETFRPSPGPVWIRQR